MSAPSTASEVRSPRVGAGELGGRAGEQLGGVDGDPDPTPQVVASPLSPLAHGVDDAFDGVDDAAAPADPEPDPVPDLTWQQQVDIQRADFGLPPLASMS